MTVDFDAQTNSGNRNTVGSNAWTHTPLGTPRGVLVLITNRNQTDSVTGVTYGGLTLTEVSGSPRVHNAGANDSVLHAYFLGSGIPSGAQTVDMTLGGAPSTHHAISITFVTSGGDTDIDATNGSDTGAGTADSLATEVVTIASETVVGFVFKTSEAGVPDFSTDLTNPFEADLGADSAAFGHLDGSGGTVTATLTQTAASGHGFGVAIKEIAATPTSLVLPVARRGRRMIVR